MTRTLATLAVFFFVTFAPGCARSSADGGCKAEEISALRQALPMVQDADARAKLVSRGLGEACTDLPRGIAKTMTDSVDPSERARFVFAAISDNLGFVKRACPDIERVLGTIATTSPAERGRIAHQGCALGTLDLITEAEMTTVMDAVGDSSAIVAAAVYVWLADHGMPKAEAKSLARAMMALP